MTTDTTIKLWNVVKPKFQREFNLGETFQVLTYNKPIWWSWGVRQKSIKNFDNQCLVFRVKGQKFRGFVCITLGWEDLYHVHFVSDTFTLKESIEGVYFDMLVDVIDRRIETT